jgi:DNA-binding CsgD family transcriptional regulator
MGDRKPIANLNDPAFYRQILDTLPAFAYLNEFQRKGDPFSCRNIWSNQFSLDFIGYSQEEITAMGYGFFQTVIHPDDLNVIPTALEIMPKAKSKPVFIGMSRIRNRFSSEYHWMYGFGIELDYFDDGSFRQMLSIGFLMEDEMQSENRLVPLLREIGRLKNELKFSRLTPREKKVLLHISESKSDIQIAGLLSISLRTAKKHRNNILQKLSLHKSSELVALAIEYGID